jgi:hypothetical protein
VATEILVHCPDFPISRLDASAHNQHDRIPMMSELSKEQQILVAMRKTLAAVVKDVTPPPGMRHPLSESTIQDVRACLALISAREKELADHEGRGGDRPYYADEPQTAQVVPIAGIRRANKSEDN